MYVLTTQMQALYLGHFYTEPAVVTDKMFQMCSQQLAPTPETGLYINTLSATNASFLKAVFSSCWTHFRGLDLT